MRYVTNNMGELLLGGVAALDLVREYGTPVYVMERDKLVGSMQSYTSALAAHYEGNGLICYASKAFCCKYICRLAQENGFGLDVVSIGELFTALSVGFDMSKVCLHGNNKTAKELELAVNSGVGRIVADNVYELELLNSICKRLGKKASVMLRIKPGIEAHTHSYIRTGGIDSKFGIALETGEALDAALFAIGLESVDLLGLHCHIGSQILSIEPYELAAKRMLELIALIKERSGVELKELNLGGGFGISYTKKESALDIDECFRRICNAVRDNCNRLGLANPFLIFEPGRSIVASAGTTLYTIGSIKHIPSVRTYVAVDGGMTDNPRYALYKSEYEMTLANKADKDKDSVVTIAGKCCESGDLLGENVALQTACVGDVLAVFCTGAYNFSMFSHYNRNLRPPVVLVYDGKSELIVKPDTLDDIISHDL